VSRRGVATGFVLGVACTLVAGALVRPAEAKRRASFDRQTFEEALSYVLDRYVEPLDESRLLSHGLKQIVAELDPHSHYLTAEERRALQRRTREGGPGFAATLRGTTIEVVAVEPGSPAAELGMVPGDTILELDGRPVASLRTQAEIDALLRGRAGVALELLVQPRSGGAPRMVRLERTDRRAPTVALQMSTSPTGKVATIRIRAFRSGTGEQVRRLLEEARLAAGPRGLAGLILDVRSNPGGEVEEALIVADLFVGQGLLTRTRGRGGKILREELAHEAGTDLRTPVIVLQDRHSASAAELLAAALQDNGRAKVAGEKSFGKGTVQKVVGLEDGSVLAFTIARYFSPKDRVIDGVGVIPDHPLAVTGPEREAQEAALALLSGATSG